MPAPNRVDVQRVRELLTKGLTPRQIAERLGTNTTSVGLIAKQMRREKA